MITVRLVNTSITSHSYNLFVCVVRTLRFTYTLNSFECTNTVLLMVSLCYILHLKTGVCKLCPPLSISPPTFSSHPR